MEHICLNCSEMSSKKFCPNCGQKTDMHRITFKHFIAHDLLHGVLHLERGIVFTLKEAILRPGRAALDYISGKRIRYYNVFYLCLILIGADIILAHAIDGGNTRGGTQESQDFIDFFKQNIKFILLAIVPMLAVNAKLLFRKLRLNLAEHFIAAGFTLTGILAMTVLMLFFGAIQNFGWADSLLDFLITTFLLLTFLFPAWAYSNLAWKPYKFLGLLWRTIVLYILLIVEAFLFMALAIMLVTGKSELVIN